jgi:chemotaxis protein methyltransferase CheR
MTTSDSLQVLITDRDRKLCHSLSGVLEATGYRVDCLIGPLTPLELRRHVPDLLLIDVPASAATEIDLLRRLSLQRSAKHLPIIVITEDPRLEFELLDVFDVLPKPLDEERLLEDLALLKARRGDPGPYPSLNEVDLALFRDYLVSHSGLHFDRRNALLLERGLQRRMRALRSPSYRDYLGYLEHHRESRQELKKLLGLLTIGETYFFRYLAHFELLREVIIPELMERNRHTRRLRIWCAGCSTGEEPYSVAMLIRERFPQLLDWQLEILGTDINKRALGAARIASYGLRALRATDPAYREAYFQIEGERFRLLSTIREMVRLEYLNLRSGPFPGAADHPLDLIFCRNVMIYFQPETIQEIIEQMAKVLQPGGYLLLGHAETLIGVRHDFSRVQYGGGFVYRLQEVPAAPPPVPQPPRIRVQPPLPAASPPKPAPLPAPPKPAADPADEAVPEVPDLAEIYAQAVAAYEQEKFKTASQSYAILLRHKPDHVGALVGYGFLLANRGEYREALDYCLRAQQVDDLYPESYFLKGLILEMEEAPEEALVEYRRALLLDMHLIMPHYALSRVLRCLGRLREAARELRNTLRLLERLPAGHNLVYGGGWTPAALAEQCRRDLAQFGEH